MYSMDEKVRRAMLLVGLVMMVLLGIVAIINAVEFFSYRQAIANDEVTMVEADVVDYKFVFRERVNHKRVNYFKCSSIIEYEVGTEVVSKSNSSCLPNNQHEYTTVYYFNDNVERYFLEKEIKFTVFLSFIWPIIGTALFVVAKKSY